MPQQDDEQRRRGSAAPGFPPEALVAYWTGAHPVLPAHARWTPLRGGRTNRIWRVDGAGSSFVVKLFQARGDTPLFANDPGAEARALAALSQTGLAPELVATGKSAVGASLVYAHVPGRVWRPSDGVGRIARALAAIHRHPVPPSIDSVDASAEALLQQGRRILAGIGPAGRALARREPVPPRAVSPARTVFLHGDATAGNVLVQGADTTFIDWQCPARGDPVLDLAVFLSPAMQAISGNRPLSEPEEREFLAAYGDAGAAKRYRALAPIFHWRMAAYCLWRASRADRGYAEAAALETARLTAVRQSTPRQA